MRTYIDCYPCFLRQAIEAARMADASQDQQVAIVMQSLDILKESPRGATPPEIGWRVHQVVREVTGADDPYQLVKQEARAKATALLPRLVSMLEASDDPLDTAIRMSIAGNIIDFGPNPNYDLLEVVKRTLTQDFAINDMEALKEQLAKAKSVMMLGDNAGESVFDRLLIERLGKPVTYVVRGGPVLNDTTLDDALAVGINSVAKVIDNGAQVPGTILSFCSDEFKHQFQSADLILAKGMGNYETLSEVEAPIFFLMQVKCPTIGVDLGVPVGSMVIKRGMGFTK